MVEEIYEPLVHMVRNSLDHGIEMPEDRLKAGKEARGAITLTAQQKGGNIVIEIHDDGRGLDAAKIRAKAVKVGLISASENLEEGALYELIFQPGFSTKEVVTEVSGRGVGMDVVKKSIDRLRGKVDIASTPGKGSTFQFKLPLTMAIIDGMVIRIGEERYIVPTVAMNESLRPPKESYVTVQGRGEVINVRNQLMPLVRLHEIFSVKPRCYNPWDALVLVVGENNRSYCLLADEIIGRQEVVIKSLGESMRHVVGVSGGAILGDGKVALIVDVKGVVTLHEGNRK
jgi:two-component system chemotaxis sensor kinase CheA